MKRNFEETIKNLNEKLITLETEKNDIKVNSGKELQQSQHEIQDLKMRN